MADGQEFSNAYVEQIASLSRLYLISIPDAVLLKLGQLTPDERVVIDSHVELGLTMVDKVLDQPGVQLLRNLIVNHHEQLDGS